ncbi:MAG: response regulator [Pseudomonadota bacterium]
MQVVFHNAESEFQKVVDSLGANPNTWQNWKCLHIEAQEFEDYKANPNLMTYAEAIIETYLLDFEGTAFFCGYHDIYMMARNIDEEQLIEIGDELCGSLLLEKAMKAKQKIYNLNSESFELIFTLCGKGPVFKVADHGTLQDIPEQAVTGSKLLNLKDNNPRVLLIEDDQSTRWIVRKALKGVCDLATAPDLSTSYERIMSFQPHVIFLDIELPDGNGISVLDWITMENLNADVIMFSSHNTMENISVAMAAGAKGFISKPFAKSKLIEHIQDCKNFH